MAIGLRSLDAEFLAEHLAVEINKQILQYEKKKKGQFFTPLPVARLMASMIRLNKTTLKILDPGAGTGILTATVCSRLIAEKKPFNVHVDLYENDCMIIPSLTKTMERCKEALESCQSTFSYTIRQEDFVLHNSGLFKPDLFHLARTGNQYDIAICNPPYFKVGMNSLYSNILKEYIHGQPNMYFMFMAVAGELLRYNGQLIFITPRSYCSGLYFERFRHKFFQLMDPDQIHLFGSRKETFYNEAVLQESMILSAFKRSSKSAKIKISSSDSADLNEIEKHEVSRELVMDTVYEDSIIRIPVDENDSKLILLFDSWNNNLSSMGMEISTGPVVIFRTAEELRPYDPLHTFPMICMHHFKDWHIHFPHESKRNEGLTINVLDRKLLLPRDNYILLKRFSSKEQKKRVEAAFLSKSDFKSEYITFENHLNYLYRTGASLTNEEAMGLTALLNSTLFDSYFRIVNGNTQVNASDIRSLPLPSQEYIIELGRRLLSRELHPEHIDNVLKRELVAVSDRIQEAIDILTAFGLPARQKNERSALTLLALLNLSRDDPWHQAQSRLVRIHDILTFIAEKYEKTYAENSRETIRRQTIHQFEQAALVERNQDDPTRPTNSGLTVYSITSEALHVIKSYGTNMWDERLEHFLDNNSTLSEKYANKRHVYRVPVKLPDGKTFNLSPGKHNELQRAVIEDFGSIYAKGAMVLYIGDTERKIFHIDREAFIKL